VVENQEELTVVSSSEVPPAVGSSSEVSPAISISSEAPTWAAVPEVSSLTRMNLLPAAMAAPVMISKVKLPEVSACQAASVPIPAPSVSQPVPTRTFAKAISALQSQLLSRPRTTTGNSKEGKVKTMQAKEIVCPWSAGDKVVARWPDGVWRQAIVNRLEMVDLINVRAHSLPVEALNLIDQGLVNSTVVRQKGDGASNEKKGVTPTVVGKVKEWMDKNMN